MSLKLGVSALLFAGVALGALSAQAQLPRSENRASHSQSGEAGRGPVARAGSSGLVAQARSAGQLQFSITASSSSGGVSGHAFSLAAIAGSPSVPVVGGGTPGRLTKWVGFGGGDSVIGDSGIFEDKLGKVGIGTDSPTSKLTVVGPIESTSGGIKFPDGTVQTTSGIGSVFHDGTLAGSGTSSSPLGIAPGAVGSAQLANAAVTTGKIAAGQVVKSLNGLTDTVTLVAGRNIAITQGAGTVSIAATGAEEPGRSPYQETLSFGFGFGPCDQQKCLLAFSQVPAGKRLVLKSISGAFLVDRGLLVQVGLAPSFTPVNIFVPTVFQGNWGQDLILANQELQAYCEAGSQPGVFIAVSGQTANLNGEQLITLTGYYVDLP
jgi:hypothetical protein